MKIDNEFTVGMPVDRAWTVLTDLEGIAPCMPGAQLTGVDGDVYSGRVKVKVGPIVAEYAGTARFLSRDEATHRAVISASGRDARGAGTASAEILAQLREDGPRTVVNVDTDLRISGRIAQLGHGMIKEVSTKLLGQFVDCLEAKLTTTVAAGAAAVGAVGAVGASEPEPGSPGPPSREPETPEPDVEPGSPGPPSREPETPEPDVEPASPGPPSREPEAPEPDVEPASPGPPGPAGAAGRSVGSDEAEPLDLMGLAGGSIAKRVIPVVLAIIVVVGVVAYLAVD
ncbi:SRPBCC family protein [Jiangella asiatica]|uniref:Carbon monoxide dehydrogenase n=1 Tax=Jiangella asiatica TaxID=2530372 RepID=A0A4R5DBU8_9ACTN|nr:SRPBCC family protein [Jiangella asiatica]TDE09470.1 carbon monoxide dehydrogenase [Jiangella asiatica]